MQGSGLVLSLFVYPSLSAACVWIGPNLASADLLMVQRDSADPEDISSFMNNMVDVLLSALEHGREVAYVTDSYGGRIMSLSVEA